jgi:acetylornithine aminotransferase
VEERGQQLQQGLQELVSRYPKVLTRVRGWGLLQGLVLAQDCGVTAPQLAKAALEQRLLLVAAGAMVLRMVPPLVISANEVRQLLRRLDATLAGLA